MLNSAGQVILDTSTMGQEAVVVKNGLRLCGTGSARGSAPILQDKVGWGGVDC